MANVYLMIVVYSLYQILVYEDVDQVKSHQNASGEGYQRCCENDGEKKQISEFNEP